MRTFYVDESGHSGANYLDPQQPVFAIGGFVVGADQEEAIAALCSTFLAESPASIRDKGEVKFGSLLRSVRGRRRVAEFIRQVDEVIGAIPVVFVEDKKYGIASRIVDSLCDHDHNPMAVQFLPLEDNLERTKLARRLWKNLPSNHLVRFAEAMRSAEAPALLEARDGIALAVRLLGKPGTADLLAACDVDSLAEDFRTQDPMHRTLQFPGFLNVVSTADEMFEKTGERGKVVADKQYESDAMYKWAIDALSVESTFTVPMSGGQRLRFGFSSIESFDSDDSAVSGLQTADALASAFRWCVATALSGGLTTRDQSVIDLAQVLWRWFDPAHPGAVFPKLPEEVLHQLVPRKR
jgi:hypothetical protein